jgi:hypothetical protein
MSSSYATLFFGEYTKDWDAYTTQIEDIFLPSYSDATARWSGWNPPAQWVRLFEDR